MPVDPNKQRKVIRYRADDGVDYAYTTSENHADAIPGTQSGAGLPPFPKNWKPRLIHAKQVNNTGRDRKISVVCYSRVIAAFTGPQSTITVAPYGVLDITGRSGERRSNGAPDYDGVSTPANGRVAIQYLSDDGNYYRLVTTRAHAAAVGAVGAGNAPAYPKRWKTRHYNCIADDLSGSDQTLRLVEPNPLSANWTSNAPSPFNINGNLFHSTGKTDENRPNGAPGYVP